MQFALICLRGSNGDVYDQLLCTIAKALYLSVFSSCLFLFCINRDKPLAYALILQLQGRKTSCT